MKEPFLCQGRLIYLEKQKRFSFKKLIFNQLFRLQLYDIVAQFERLRHIEIDRNKQTDMAIWTWLLILIKASMHTHFMTKL